MRDKMSAKEGVWEFNGKLLCNECFTSEILKAGGNLTATKANLSKIEKSERKCFKCGKSVKTEGKLSPANTSPKKRTSRSDNDISKKPELKSKTGTVLRQTGKATPITREKEIVDKKNWEVKNLPVWRPGDVILDTYEVEDVFSGGMGHVYIAHHNKWKVKLAIKSPNEMMLEKKSNFARILREANSWTELGLHPNIAYCYYVRNIEGVPHIFVEYVDGGNLKGWIQEGKCIDYRTSLDLAIQFCHGMEHAHSKGMIHRDVKPENILMTQDGILKITDFGLVRGEETIKGEDQSNHSGSQEEDSSLTVVGAEMGTWGYMSPEQKENPHGVDERTDIFAFGICLYEMFCGNRPYKITFGPRQEPPYPVSLSGDVNFPSDIASVLTKVVQWEPSERYSSFVDIRQAFCHIYSDLYGEESPYAALELVDPEADGLNNQGVAYYELGRKDDAIECWKKAQQINQLHLEATYNRSLIQWRDAKIDDGEVLRHLENCGNNPSADKERLAELTAYIHAERYAPEDAREMLKIYPGKYESVFSGKNIGQTKCVRTMKGHSDDVNSVAVSPDGRYAVSGSRDKTLRMWNLQTGQCVHTKSRSDHISALVVTPDGRYVLTGEVSGNLSILDLETDKWVRDLKDHRLTVKSVAITPDGRHVVSGSDDATLRVWELETGQCVHTMEGHKTYISAVAITPDGRHVVSGSWDDTLRMWELETGICVRTMKEHTDPVNSVVISPDGRYAVSGSRDKSLRMWELETGKCVHNLKTQHRIGSIVILPDGRHAISNGSNYTLRIWELETGRCVRTMEGHTAFVASVAISPDGRHAISGSWDNTLRMWELGTGMSYKTEPMVSLPKGFQQRKKEEQVLNEKIREAEKFYKMGDYKQSFAILFNAWKDIKFSHRDAINKVYSKLINNARIKDIAFYFQKLILEGHTGNVYSVTFTQDGRYAISGSWDKTLRMWELETGICIRTMEGQSFDSVSVTPDGRYAVSGSRDNNLRIWSLESGKCMCTMKGHARWITSVCIAPDGQYAVSGSDDKTLRMWDLKTGQCVRTMKGHTLKVKSVAISPDGRCAVSGSDDATLRVWELKSGNCVRTMGRQHKVKSLALTPDGRYAVYGSGDGALGLWEFETGQCVRTIEGHSSDINSVAVTPDGRYAVSGSQDKTMRVWELKTGNCLCTMGMRHRVISVTITPNGRYVVSGNADNTVQVWDLETGRWVRTMEILSQRNRHRLVHPSIFSVAITPDGQHAVSGGQDKTLKIWDLATGRWVRTMYRHGHTRWVTSVCITPDGRYAVSGSDDKTLRMWDLETGQCVCTMEGHTNDIKTVAVTPDGRRVVSGSSDKTLRIWDLETGQCVCTIEGHTNDIKAVAVTPDGRRVVSGSSDKTLRIWDLKTGVCLRSTEGHDSNIKTVAITPDGRRVVSGSSDETLRIWDLKTGRCLHTMEGHSASINSVAVTPDGRYAVSGSWDKTLRIWNLETGLCLCTMVGHIDRVESVSQGINNKYAISGSSDNTLRVWELIWDLEFPDPVDWDEGIRPYLEIFLTLRNGEWTEDDFQGLLNELAEKRGYGWVRPEGIRKELEEMTNDFSNKRT
jgi:WD40 repeat protein